MPKVTVIVCSRNREELLYKRSLLSVFNQAYMCDTVVVDDASLPVYLDPALVIGFPKFNTKLIRNEERQGLAVSRNTGAKATKGEYIVFLDDDNEFLPGFLEQTVAYLDSHPEEDAVAVGRIVEYPEGIAYQPPVVDGSMNDGFLIRRKAFLDIKCDPELTANEDADFGIRFHAKYKCGAIHKPLMRVWASPIINTTSYSDYSDYHLDGLARFWLKHHAADYRKYIGRMFLLAAGSPKWFKWLYYLETKMKRYWQILKWKLCS